MKCQQWNSPPNLQERITEQTGHPKEPPQGVREALDGSWVQPLGKGPNTVVVRRESPGTRAAAVGTPTANAFHRAPGTQFWAEGCKQSQCVALGTGAASTLVQGQAVMEPHFQKC